MSENTSKPSDSLRAATSPRSSVSSKTQPSRLRRAVTAIAAATSMAAAACGPVADGQSNDANGTNACDTAEANSSVRLKFNDFKLQSEYLYDPVKGIKIDLDCDVSGITEGLKEACGAPIEIALFGNVTVDYGPPQFIDYPDTLLKSQPITADGQQFLSVDLLKNAEGYPIIAVEKTYIQIRTKDGKVLLDVGRDPDQARL